MKIECIDFIDTFAGIGGFHLAAEAACSELGIKSKCVGAVEFDKNAAKTYENFFKINPTGDMTKIAPASFLGHDLLLGGPPCQAFSRNGKYYNKNKKTVPPEEDRANLFFRLFDVLKAKQPKFFVFENVKEINTIKNGDGTFVGETVIENLKDCGYDVSMQVLDSARFDLPQQRRRAYFVGTREDLDLKDMFIYPEGRPLKISVEDILEKSAPDALLLKNLWRNRKIGQEEVSVIKGIKKIRELKSDSKYADALEKEWKKQYARVGLKASISRFKALQVAYDSGDWKQLQSKCDEIWPLAIIYGDTPSGLPRQQDKLYSIKGISPTIATFSTPNFDCPEGWRMLMPRECATLQGFPINFKLPEDDTAAYKQLGNAVSINTAKAVIKRLLETALQY